MQRPRNRQSQGSSHENRGRGRGRGGLHRSQNDGNSQRSIVPSINQVLVGSFVSIVLKADQSSARQVQGLVQDILTNGNHPRGIKVRLQDGRVGRVQRMCTEAEARAASEYFVTSNEPANGDDNVQTNTGSASRRRMRYTDARDDEGTNLPTSQKSLADYLPAEDNSSIKTDAKTDESAKTRCPVCEQFEGDEIAVAHHVNSHFD